MDKSTMISANSHVGNGVGVGVGGSMSKKRHSTKVFNVTEVLNNRNGFLQNLNISPLKALAFNFRFNQVLFTF